MGTRLEHDVENLTGDLIDESAMTPWGKAMLRLLVDIREQLPVAFVPVDQAAAEEETQSDEAEGTGWATTPYPVQLASTAYTAYIAAVLYQCPPWTWPVAAKAFEPWESLAPEVRQCWIKAAEAVRDAVLPF